MSRELLADDRIVGLAAAPHLRPLSQGAYADEALIARLVHDALRALGLGQTNPQAPLADVIAPGMTVLLKPNWVLHRNDAGLGMDCMVTHSSVILAALAQVVACRPGRIVIGDAPLQGCQWDTLIPADFEAKARAIAGDIPLTVVDFRRTTIRDYDLAGGVSADRRSTEHYCLFDLGDQSLLEPISDPPGRFRVTMYDPQKLAQTHHAGKHQYLLCREAFEADVILNLPKLKTHRKSGITAALKNLVGLNGNKDYLPHHRLGGPARGGDCYAGDEPWKFAAELYTDMANMHIGTPEATLWSKRASDLLWLHARFASPDIEGAWYGNDTIWRTVLDLNRILLYGRADGTMADAPQRTVITLTDAVVVGEGEGPLAVRPRTLGVVTAGRSCASADRVHAALLGLDAEKIPLVREATKGFAWPIAKRTAPPLARVGERNLSLPAVAAELGIQAQPPAGWKGHCEMDAPQASAVAAQPPNPAAPSGPATDLDRARAALAANRLDEALVLSQRVLLDNAQCPDALRLAADALDRKEQFIDALALWAQVARQCPDDPQARQALARAGVAHAADAGQAALLAIEACRASQAKWKMIEWTPENSARMYNWLSRWPAGQDRYFSYQVGAAVVRFLAALTPVGGNVLDYGCGPGYLLQELLNAGIQCHGMDMSVEAVLAVNTRFAGNPLWRGAALFDGKELPYEDGFFDVVFCVETIEHVLPQYMDSLLGSLRRILKPRTGVLLMTTPNREKLERNMVYCPECGLVFHKVQHVRSLSVQSLTTLMEDHGFTTALCNATNFEKIQQMPTLTSAQVPQLLGAGPHLFWMGQSR